MCNRSFVVKTREGNKSMEERRNSNEIRGYIRIQERTNRIEGKKGEKKNGYKKSAKKKEE